MKENNYKVVFVNEAGKDIDFIVDMVPGFREIFITAYNMAADYFNDNIDRINKEFDIRYPDHKTDLDDVNDIYYDYIRDQMSDHVKLINWVLLGPGSKYEFGYFEQANFGLKIDNKVISVILRPVK